MVNNLNQIIFPTIPNTIGFAWEGNSSSHHGYVTHSLKFNNPKNGRWLAEGFNGNVDQHKIPLLTVHNTMGFASETN